MSSSPQITAVMAVRNNGRTLACALESLLWQTLQDWELILIDDGSDDDSLAIAERFRDTRLKIVSDGGHSGLAARLNQGIALARGGYIARMDADDVSYPQRLELQLATLEKHPDIDLVGTAAMVFGDNGLPVGSFPVRKTHAEICERPWAGFYLPHPTWMGRTAWFRKHPYDPVALKAQDQVLLLEAYDASRFACLPEILLGYRQQSVSLAKSAAGRYHFCRGLVRRGMRNREYGFALRGLVEQAAKLAFESVVIPTGLARRALRHRALPPSEQALAQWRRVWSELSERVASQNACSHPDPAGGERESKRPGPEQG